MLSSFRANEAALNKMVMKSSSNACVAANDEFSLPSIATTTIEDSAVLWDFYIGYVSFLCTLIYLVQLARELPVYKREIVVVLVEFDLLQANLYFTSSGQSEMWFRRKALACRLRTIKVSGVNLFLLDHEEDD